MRGCGKNPIRPSWDSGPQNLNLVHLEEMVCVLMVSARPGRGTGSRVDAQQATLGFESLRARLLSCFLLFQFFPRAVFGFTPSP